MARDYQPQPRMHDFYLQLQDLHIPAHHYHHPHHQHQLYDAHHGGAAGDTSAPPYELTAGEGAGGGGGGGPGGAGATGPGRAGGGGGGGAAPLDPQPAAHHHHGELRKRKTTAFPSDAFELSSPGCDAGGGRGPPLPPPPPPAVGRKRKSSTYLSAECGGGASRGPSSGGSVAYDDDGNDDSRSSSRTMPDKKQNHSEIEKRRRDKMNTYIAELASMVPRCGGAGGGGGGGGGGSGASRKLDKLTVLRMAVQHLRGVRGALAAGPLAAGPRPACLEDARLSRLALRAAAAARCLVLAVGCDRGRLLYVSASVRDLLHYDRAELVGQSLFDILHPKDVAKVKEQLSSPDLSPRERLIDAKTMLPVKADVVAGASRLCPGARRSFFCRIKCKPPAAPAPATAPPGPDAPPAAAGAPVVVKEEGDAVSKMRKKQPQEKKYCVVQFTGYLKSWAPAEMGEGGGGEGAEGGEEGEASSLSCLVAVGRALPEAPPAPPAPPAAAPATRRLQYVSRHATDGKFLFVDQRVTLALGFLPQELLGTSLYEYVSAEELGAVARTHKSALLRLEPAHTLPYRFRCKNGLYARIQTHFKPFRNPWTKDVECLVANNTKLDEEAEAARLARPRPRPPAAADLYKQKSDAEVQRLIDSQVESHKIGSAIAEEVLRRSSPGFSPELPVDLLQDPEFGQQASLVDNILGAEGAYGHVRNDVPLSAVGAARSPLPEEAGGAGPPAPGGGGGEGAGAGGSGGSPGDASPPLPPLGLDGNGEAAMAVIMSLLEADAGLGGPINFTGLPWPLP